MTAGTPPGTLVGMPHSTVSLLTLLVVGGVLVAFGYAWAVMKRANKDYKTTKKAVSSMRKGFWSSLWVVVRLGVGVFIAVVAIIAWNVRDFQNDGDPLVPARADVTPSPSRR